MEKTIMTRMMGCFSEKTRGRLRTISGLLTLPQQRMIQMESLQNRVATRAKDAKNWDAAQKDPGRLNDAKKALGYTALSSRMDIHKEWSMAEKKRVRRLPATGKGKLVPALSLKCPNCRRAAIQWYCGTFPVLPTVSNQSDRDAIQCKLTSLNALMGKKVWTAAEFSDAERVLEETRRTFPTRWA